MPVTGIIETHLHEDFISGHLELGEGKILGLFTMAGMILGTYTYALLAERNKNI